MESRRHPYLRPAEHDVLDHTRDFLDLAVRGAITRGELSRGTDTRALVEMLVALVWGPPFYAGFVGSHQHPDCITAQFRQLLDGTVWSAGGTPTRPHTTDGPGDQQPRNPGSGFDTPP